MSPISRTVVAAALGVAALTACTPFGSSDEETSADVADEAVERTVPVPPERLTPFCGAMIGLADRLENDPPDDIEGEIIETYESIADEVPAELQVDFEVVLAELRGEPIPTVATSPPTSAPAPDADDSGTDGFRPEDESTSAPATATTVDGAVGASTTAPDAAPGSSVPLGDAFFDEGRLPGETPAERINGYVDFVCRGNQNNPGPPATEPGAVVPTSEP